MSSSRHALLGLIATASALVAAALLQRARGGLELRLVALAFVLLGPAARRVLALAGELSPPSAASALAEAAALAGSLLAYPCPSGALVSGLVAAALARGGEASGNVSYKSTLVVLFLSATGALAASGAAAAMTGKPAIVFILIALVVSTPGPPRAPGVVVDLAAARGLVGAAALLAWSASRSAELSIAEPFLLLATLGAGWAAVRSPSPRAHLALSALVLAAGAHAFATASRAPIGALAGLGLVAALPALAAEARGEGQDLARAERWRGALVVLGLVWSGAALVTFARAALPRIGGVDCFFYLCFARDLVLDPAHAPEIRFIYCPGVYVFWRAAFSLGGVSLGTAQSAYLLALAGNAALVGWIAGRATRSAASGAFSALWTAVLTARYEGLEGGAEPLVTLPALADLAVWGGAPLRGHAGALKALALGVGLGLALYVKQQGILLAAGAATLLVRAVTGAPERRHHPACLALGAGALAAAFLVPVGLEGAGLAPLRGAFFHARVYPVEGTFSGHLASVAGAEWPFAAAGLLALAAAIAGLRSGATEDEARASSLVLFCVAAAAGSGAQLTKRGYLHYVLLAVPFVVIAAVLGARLLAERLPERTRERPLSRIAPFLVAAFLLSARSRDATGFHAFPAWLDEPWSRPLQWYEEPEVRADLAEVGRHVRAGEELVLIPPRQQSLSFLLGTKTHSTPLAYGWAPELGYTYDDVSWDKVDAVLVTGLDPELRRELRGDGALADLEKRGFSPVVRRPHMTLWRRRP